MPVIFQIFLGGKHEKSQILSNIRNMEPEKLCSICMKGIACSTIVYFPLLYWWKTTRSSFSGDIQDPPGQGPVQLAVGDPASAGGSD